MLFGLLTIALFSGLVAADHYAEIDDGINPHIVEFQAAVGEDIKPMPIRRAIFQPYNGVKTFCTNPIKTVFIYKFCKPATVGICWGLTIYGIIEIAEAYPPGSVMEEAVIWHEISHCGYGEPHSDHPDGCSDCKIMNPYLTTMTRKELELEKEKLVKWIKNKHLKK